MPPSLEFTPELGDAICERVAIGESMRTITAQDGMPAISSVFKWLRLFPEFAEQYARAKEQAADLMAEDIISIADDGSNDTYKRDLGDGLMAEEVNFDHIQRSKLRVEARKWIAAKLKPKKYGDRIQQDVEVKINDALADRLAKAQQAIVPPAAGDHG